MKPALLFWSILSLPLFLSADPAPTVQSLPPSVIETAPKGGSTDVDAGTTTQIRVTFSKEMANRSWSWSQLSERSFPEIIGEPKYLKDQRTCVINVKLEPNKTYAIWLNSTKFKNFKDTAGNPAVPYLLVFQTRQLGPV